MKTFKLFAILFFVFVLNATSKGQTNFINNGGFEQSVWIDGTQAQEWDFGAGGGETTGSVVMATNGIVPPEGIKMGYVKCLAPTTYAYQTVYKPLNGKGLSLKSGAKYIVQYKVYSIAGTTGMVPKMALSLYSVAPYFHTYQDGNSYTDVPAGSWQTISYSFTATSSAAAGTDLNFVLGVCIKGNETNTIFYVDDFKVLEDVKVTSISLDASDINTNSATSLVTASILPANATEQGVTWSISDPSIATISSTGLLIPKKNGTVIVTASSNELGSSIVGTKTIIISNQGLNKIVNGGFEQSSYIDGTNAQEWPFHNGETEGYIVGSTNGIVPQEGSFMFYLKCLVPTSYLYSTVSKPVSGNGISLNSGSKYILKFKAYSIPGTTGIVPKMAVKLQGASAPLNSYINPIYFDVPGGSWNTYSFSFTASSTLVDGANIGAVLGLLVQGNEAGTVFYVDDFKVLEDIKVASISLAASDISSNSATSLVLATVLPDNAAEKGLTWTINDPSIATVSPTGLVIPKKNGTVIVSASSNEAGSSISAIKTITISNQGENKIFNGGFEQATFIDGTNAQEWVFHNGETEGYRVGNTNGIVPQEGSYMFYTKCLAPTTYTFSTVYKPTSGVGVSLNSGSKYILKFKAYSISGTSGIVPKMAIKLTGASAPFNNYISPTYFDVPVGTWKSYSFEFSASSSSLDGTNIGAVLGLLLQGNEANTIFYFDDFQVLEDIKVSSITLAASDINLNSTTSLVTATILPANAAEQGLTWSIDDPSIATISSTGLVIPKKNGTVVVTAFSNEIGSKLTASKIITISNQDDNKIMNGGFEQVTWINGTQAQEWPFHNGETEGYRVGTTNGISPQEGNYMFYVKCLVPTTYIYPTVYKPSSGNGISLNSGMKYVLKFKVYSIPGTIGIVPKIAVKLQGTSAQWDSYIDPVYFEIPAGSWQSYSFSFTATSSAVDGTTIGAMLSLFMQGNEANTIFYFDNFSIAEPQQVVTALSVNELKSTGLYPNPVIDRCKVSDGNYSSVKVYDLAGAMVLNSKIESNNEIDMSNLKSGYYSVVLQGDRQKVFKVIKK